MSLENFTKRKAQVIKPQERVIGDGGLGNYYPYQCILFSFL